MIVVISPLCKVCSDFVLYVTCVLHQHWCPAHYESESESLKLHFIVECESFFYLKNHQQIFRVVAGVFFSFLKLIKTSISVSLFSILCLLPSLYSSQCLYCSIIFHPYPFFSPNNHIWPALINSSLTLDLKATLVFVYYPTWFFFWLFYDQSVGALLFFRPHYIIALFYLLNNLGPE